MGRILDRGPAGALVSDQAQKTTRALASPASGDQAGADELLPLVYQELRLLARRYMQREGPDHTLQPTALVHEAYVRLTEGTEADWRGKTHFYAVAARQMKRVLIDHARAGAAEKRGGSRVRVELHDRMAAAEQRPLESLALAQALERLAARSERQSRVAELRLFSDLRVEEIAQVLGVSARTVKQDWRVARAWLSRTLREGRAGA